MSDIQSDFSLFKSLESSCSRPGLSSRVLPRKGDRLSWPVLRSCRFATEDVTFCTDSRARELEKPAIAHQLPSDIQETISVNGSLKADWGRNAPPHALLWLDAKEVRSATLACQFAGFRFICITFYFFPPRCHSEGPASSVDVSVYNIFNIYLLIYFGCLQWGRGPCLHFIVWRNVAIKVQNAAPAYTVGGAVESEIQPSALKKRAVHFGSITVLDMRFFAEL